MYNFIIKSNIHDYSVNFIDDIKKIFHNHIKDNDIIIIDKKIKDLYINNKLQSLLKKNYWIEIDANEKQKSYSELAPIINKIITHGFKKNNTLIAIGGGITQDVTSFISSVLYRGVDWIFFPTTLLAQGDSCIGSKTSINFDKYKNQIGGFYPPNKIFIDLDFIESLPNDEIRSGIGEMLHYFIISGKEDFDFFKNNYKNSYHDRSILSQLILKSLKIKKIYIEKDEYDKNIRQVFNYGHSFGHAIESLTNYTIPHGIAVSFGIDIANYISVKMGLLSPNIRNDIKGVTRDICKNFNISNINISKFVDTLGKDKKNVGNKLGLILASDYGNVFKRLVSPDSLFLNWIDSYFKYEL